MLPSIAILLSIFRRYTAFIHSAAIEIMPTTINTERSFIKSPPSKERDSLSDVVQSNMVGIAVSDVGLIAYGDLGTDLVSYIII